MWLIELMPQRICQSPESKRTRTVHDFANVPHDAPNEAIRCRNDEYTPWFYTLQIDFLSVMQIREVLAKNLKSLREDRKISQEELAHRADIDRTYVSALERCVYSVSIDVLDRMAVVLGVEAADLLKRPSSD